MSAKNSSKGSLMMDVDSITLWLEKRNTEISKGHTSVNEATMPILARVICGGENEIANLEYYDRKVYEKHFKDNKKNSSALTLVGSSIVSPSIGAIASGFGTASTIASLGSAGLGATSLGITAASGLSAVGMGATAFIPALWPIGISMLALSAGTLFLKSKKKRENLNRVEKLENIFNKSQTSAQQCNEKIKKNNEKIKTILSKKLKAALDSLSDTTKKISIRIDDALNSDQNLRIMQYQEIVVKQYESHNELRIMLADLVDAYNKLVAENEQLAEKVAAYEAVMKMCGCTNNYIA